MKRKHVTVETRSPEETGQLGLRLSKLLRAGDIVALDGDLGAGKTCFTQAVASGLEIKSPVTSPSFTLVNEYEGVVNLYHFDAYRLLSAYAFYAEGFDEYFYAGGICVIEWASRLADMLPDQTIHCTINRGADDLSRIFHFDLPLDRDWDEI